VEIGFWNGGRRMTNVAFTMLVGNSAAAMLTMVCYANVCLGSGDFLDGCTKNSTSSDNNDIFLNLKMMKVNNPDSRIYDANNETECRKQCLNSNLCQAYSLTDICWIWTENLSNLQEEYTNGGRNLSIRVTKSVIGTLFTP
jgi:hypothetical protein